MPEENQMQGEEEQEKIYLTVCEIHSSMVAKKEDVDHREYHKKALDDLVNVNSLFTIAVFVGLSLASPTQLQGLETKPECQTDPGMGKRLIAYEVISFACLAKSLKVYFQAASKIDGKESKFIKTRIKNCLEKGQVSPQDTPVVIFYGRGLMFALSVAASIAGVVLLTLAMANVVQIKVGKLSCGSSHAVTAVSSLYAIVLIALSIYLPSMWHAVKYCACANNKSE